MVKNLPANAGDVSSIPGLGRGGGGTGNPLQYSCLRKSHGQRSLAGYSPWGHQRVGHELATEHEHEGPSLMGGQPPLACGSQREDLETY